MRFHKSLIYKQVFFFLLVSLSIIIIFASYFYYYSRNAIIERTYDQLTAIREIKKNQIEFIFNDKINTARLFAKSDFAKYILRNLINTNYNPSYKSDFYFDVNNFYDFKNIYFFGKNISGNNFGYVNIINNIHNDNIPDSTLYDVMHNLWIEVRHNKDFVITDYICRFPGDTAPAILLAFPFTEIEYSSICEQIIVFEISSRSITDILLRYSPEKGFGNSGEAYVVGSDSLMRSESRFIKNAILKVKVNSDAVNNALDGKEGKTLTKDYRNINVYSSYAPIEIYGIKWAILSEIDYKEAMKSIIAMRNDIVFLTTVIFLFVISISVFLALKIVNPIRKLEKAVQKIGEGKFDVHVKNKPKDEIGSLMDSFNNMTDKLTQITSELKEREQRLNHFYEATVEGILIHDACKPILMNHALLNITGYNESELKTTDFNIWIKNYSVSIPFFETELLTKDGNIIFVEVQNNSLSLNNSKVDVTIIRDVTVRKKTETELANLRKERLSALFNGQEIERQRISRELHDGLGQKLAGIKLKLENIPDTSEVKSKILISNIKENLTSSIEELRRISYNLRTPVLNELGFLVALENLCIEFQTDSNINCEFSSFGDFKELPVIISTYLYRICQEGLNNILKHSKAINVDLQLIENQTHYIVIIEDDGVGFNYSKDILHKGNGLFNIHERISLLNGTVTVESIIDKGTTLRIKIPKKMHRNI